MSLVEVLVSTALTLALSGTVLSLVGAGQVIARTQPERADLQQRARIALQVIGADLRDAGAGVDGAPVSGPLNAWFPPIARSPEGGLTVWRAVGGAAQGTLAIAVVPSATLLTLADSPGCPPGQGACGFSAGTTVLVFGSGGCRAAGRVGSVGADTLQLAAPPGCALSAGTIVAEGVARTYFVDAAARQLMRRDESSGSLAPVIDGVTSLSTALFADAAAAMPIAGAADGDLIRVRRVRLTLRLTASNPLLRISDLDVTVDAAPRNLQGG